LSRQLVTPTCRAIPWRRRKPGEGGIRSIHSIYHLSFIIYPFPSAVLHPPFSFPFP
jgi:hypothetical protein